MKTNLRIKAKNLRKTLQLEQISQALAAKVRQCSCYIEAKNIMLFYPTKYEVNLLELLQDEEKHFYFPRVNGSELEVCPCSEYCKFEKSDYNIQEPCTNPVSANVLDLVVVPALMVDKKGNRLGYGGGYYDRFLSKLKVKTICAIPKELIIDELPVENFDILIDTIISV